MTASLLTTAPVALGAIFGVSLALKLLDLEGVKGVVAAWPLPEGMRQVAPAAMVVADGGTALLLLFGPPRLAGLMALTIIAVGSFMTRRSQGGSPRGCACITTFQVALPRAWLGTRLVLLAGLSLASVLGGVRDLNLAPVLTGMSIALTIALIEHVVAMSRLWYPLEPENA